MTETWLLTSDPFGLNRSRESCRPLAPQEGVPEIGCGRNPSNIITSSLARGASPTRRRTRASDQCPKRCQHEVRIVVILMHVEVDDILGHFTNNLPQRCGRAAPHRQRALVKDSLCHRSASRFRRQQPQRHAETVTV